MIRTIVFLVVSLSAVSVQSADISSDFNLKDGFNRCVTYNGAFQVAPVATPSVCASFSFVSKSNLIKVKDPATGQTYAVGLKENAELTTDTTLTLGNNNHAEFKSVTQDELFTFSFSKMIRESTALESTEKEIATKSLCLYASDGPVKACFCDNLELSKISSFFLKVTSPAATTAVPASNPSSK